MIKATGEMITDGILFKKAVNDIIKERKPKKIIETGTFLGMGTTLILVEALEYDDYELYTMEVNPIHCSYAKQNLFLYPKVKIMEGLSIPLHLLPSEEVLKEMLLELKDKDIYVDFEEEERVKRYIYEIDHRVKDDMLKICIEKFDYCPDLILLDSSGHLGFIEFIYTLSLLKGKCIFILDDTNHLKHYKSLEYIKNSKNFSLIIESKEKFGFCIAEYLGGVS